MAGARRGDPHYASHVGFIRVLTVVYAIAAFTVILLAARETPGNAHAAMIDVPLALLAATVVAGFVVPWRQIARRWAFWLALTQLVITVLLAASFYSTNNAIPLLALIPVLWIAFQLDWAHTLAMLFALVIGNIAFLLLADSIPNMLRAIAACAIFTFVVGSLAVLTQANVQALRSSRTLAERARAEAERNAAALRAIADAVDASVMFRSDNDSFTFTNPKARSWGNRMGIDPHDEHWVGSDVYGADRVTPVPPENQLLPRALAGEFVSDHLIWIGPPGDQLAISASSRPAITDQGVRIGTVVVGHDITALIESLHAAESFSATVAHELRTPLTSAVGYLDLLDDAEELSAANRAFLERARDGVVALADRLRELLEPFEVATIEPKVTFTDLGTLVAERVGNWRETAGGRGLELAYQAPVDPPRVPVDHDLVARMIDTIVSNAVKFSDAGSVIEIAVSSTETRARIVVHDNGPGMMHEERRHAFERFYRGPTAIRRAVPGFGLGLSTALSIVRAHGGTIHLHSEPGRGTTVTVELPLVFTSSKAAEAATGQGHR